MRSLTELQKVYSTSDMFRVLTPLNELCFNKLYVYIFLNHSPCVLGKQLM